MRCFGFFILFALRFAEAAVSGQSSVRIPKQLSVLVGSCVIIPCHVDRPWVAPDRMWLKGGADPNDPGVTIIYNSKRPESADPAYQGHSGMMTSRHPNNCSFWISSINNEDEGEYYFTATIGGKMIPSEPVFLSVFEKPNISVTEEIIAGQAVTLTCSLVQSCPDTKIDLKWIESSSFFAAASATEFEDIDTGFDHPDWKGSQKASSMLTFAALRQHDGKVLGCEILVSGHAQGMREMVTLDVQYPPTDSVANSTPVIVLGRSASILCSTQSNPQSSLKWVKDGRIVSNTSSNNVLKTEFSNITFKDEGQYFCFAANKHGTSVSSINLAVEYPPSKPLVNSSLTVREGRSMLIYCITQSKPESRLQWMKDGVPIKSSYSNNVLTVRFPAIQYGDGGEYQCEAKNKHGTVSSWMNITVEYAPRKPVVNASIVTMEGSSFFICCKAQGNPPVTLRWMRHGEEISTSSTSELKEIFQNISSKEDGQYWCTAENYLGIARSSTMISVEYPPRIVEPPHCTRAQNTITCVCTLKANPSVEHITWSLDGRNITGNSSDFGVASSPMDSNLMLSTLTLNKELGLEHNLSCYGTNKHGVTFSTILPYLPEGWFSKLAFGIGAAVVIPIVLIVIFVARKFRKKRKKGSLRYWRAEKAEYPDSDGGEVTSNSTEQNDEITYANVQFSTIPQEQQYVHCNERGEYAVIKFT